MFIYIYNIYIGICRYPMRIYIYIIHLVHTVQIQVETLKKYLKINT